MSATIFLVTVFEKRSWGDYSPRTETVRRVYPFSTEEKARAFKDGYRGPKYEPAPEVYGPEPLDLDTGRPL